MGLATDIFKGSAKKELTNRLPQFKEGVHIASVKLVKCFETFGNGPAFVAEFKIIESSDPKELPGSERGWFQSLQGTSAFPGMNQVYSFCLALEGIDTGKVTKAELAALKEHIEGKLTGSYEGLYVDSYVRVEGVAEPDKKDPSKIFIKPKFSPVPAEYIARLQK